MTDQLSTTTGIRTQEETQEASTKFLVLGAGSLGGYFGAKLLQGGAHVEFLVRPKRAAQLAERGLVVRSHEGETTNAIKTLQAGEIQNPYDVVLLCCKAYDLDDAIAAIAPAIGPATAILPLLNGVRHLAVLSDYFGNAHVLGGLTAVNAAVTPEGDIVRSPVKVEMTAFGELDGSVSDRCLAIQRSFTAGGIKAAVSEAIMVPMWTKFVGFCTIAAIMTLCRSRAGGITAAPAAAALIAATLDECTRVASAAGYPHSSGLADVIRGLFTDRKSNYGPSILLDMEAGRPTEAEHTLGDMVEHALRGAVDAPILTAALCNLQVYEAMRSAT